MKDKQTHTPADGKRSTRLSGKAQSTPGAKGAEGGNGGILNWVECGKCNDWILFENCGVKGPYDEKRLEKEKIECKTCKLLDRVYKLERDNSCLQQHVLDLEDRLKAIEEQNKELTQREAVVNDLKSRIESVMEENAGMSKTIGEIKDRRGHFSNSQEENENTDNLSHGQIRQASQELREIEARRNNVVVWGLPEQGNDKGDLLKFVKDQHYSLTPIEEENIVSIERLGKAAPNKIRMLRVKADTMETRKNLLNLHHHKRDLNETTKVYIRPDLTKLQQEADKKLREEWTMKGRDRFVIKGGKIVPRAEGNPEARRGMEVRPFVSIRGQGRKQELAAAKVTEHNPNRQSPMISLNTSRSETDTEGVTPKVTEATDTVRPEGPVNESTRDAVLAGKGAEKQKGSERDNSRKLDSREDKNVKSHSV